MKFPLALPITAPVIIAGNDMGRSAIFHFSAQIKWLCWKANITVAASGLAHFSVPLGLRKYFLSAGLADGDKAPTPPPWSTLFPVRNDLIFQLKTVSPSQATGCNSSLGLFEKKKGRNS